MRDICIGVATRERVRNFAEAFAYLEKGRAKGKVVVTMA
jgi:hypothetical protein